MTIKLGYINSCIFSIECIAFVLTSVWGAGLACGHPMGLKRRPQHATNASSRRKRINEGDGNPKGGACVFVKAKIADPRLTGVAAISAWRNGGFARRGRETFQVQDRPYSHRRKEQDN